VTRTHPKIPDGKNLIMLNSKIFNGIAPLVIVAALFGSGAMFSYESADSKQVDKQTLPQVSTQTVQSQPLLLHINGFGNVTAKQELDLTAEVSGRVVWLSPEFEVGKLLPAGTPLLRIDDLDYRLEVSDAEANLRENQLRLAEEKIKAAQAHEDWASTDMRLNDDLALRKPQLAHAQARVQAAHQRLLQAKRNLSRTTLSTDRAVVVQSRNIDLGEYLNVGSNIAHLLGAEVAQVRIPVTITEMTYLNEEDSINELVTLNQAQGNSSPGSGAKWLGYLRSIDHQLNPNTRMLFVTVEIDDPYGLVEPRDQALRMGLFVEALIPARLLPSAVKLPRSAIHTDGDLNRVYVLSHDNHLRSQVVKLVRWNGDQAIIDSGLLDGDRVVTTRMSVMFNGMAVTEATPQQSSIDVSSIVESTR